MRDLILGRNKRETVGADWSDKSDPFALALIKDVRYGKRLRECQEIIRTHGVKGECLERLCEAWAESVVRNLYHLHELGDPDPVNAALLYTHAASIFEDRLQKNANAKLNESDVYLASLAQSKPPASWLGLEHGEMQLAKTRMDLTLEAQMFKTHYSSSHALSVTIDRAARRLVETWGDKIAFVVTSNMLTGRESATHVWFADEEKGERGRVRCHIRGEKEHTLCRKKLEGALSAPVGVTRDVRVFVLCDTCKELQHFPYLRARDTLQWTKIVALEKQTSLKQQAHDEVICQLENNPGEFQEVYLRDQRDLVIQEASQLMVKNQESVQRAWEARFKKRVNLSLHNARELAAGKATITNIFS